METDLTSTAYGYDQVALNYYKPSISDNAYVRSAVKHCGDAPEYITHANQYGIPAQLSAPCPSVAPSVRNQMPLRTQTVSQRMGDYAANDMIWAPWQSASFKRTPVMEEQPIIRPNADKIKLDDTRGKESFVDSPLVEKVGKDNANLFILFIIIVFAILLIKNMLAINDLKKYMKAFLSVGRQ